MTLAAKDFSAPDEVREFPKAQVELVRLGDVVVGRATYQPGWRWSEHIGTALGTSTCHATHTGYVISGRLHVAMTDGPEGEAGPGEVFVIPPGHDGWVVGDEPCVLLDFTGMTNLLSD